MNSRKPRLFIGSSVEGLDIAYAAQANLEFDVEVTVWNQGVFELSGTAIESLITVLEKSDFGLFVFSPDDILKMKGNEYHSVRDNVIFELGLFVGSLGRHRTFVIVPDKENLHIPTDLLGVTVGHFKISREDNNLQAATGVVCNQIRNQIKKNGLRFEDLYISEGETNEITSLAKDDTNESQWWSFYQNKDYSEAYKILKDEISQKPDDPVLTFYDYDILLKWKPVETKREIESGLDNIMEPFIIITALLANDELEFARVVIEKILLTSPNDKRIILIKARYLDKIGKTQEAIDLLLSVDYTHETNIIMAIIGLFESLNSDVNIKFQFLLKMYNIHPSNDEISFKLATVAQEIEKHCVALLILDKLVKKFPENTTYLGYLGNSCLSLGLNNKAMEFYKRGNVLAKSKEAWIVGNIGNLLNNQGLFTDAKGYLDLAISIDTSSEYSFNRLATVLKSIEEEQKRYGDEIKKGIIDMQNEGKIIN